MHFCYFLILAVPDIWSTGIPLAAKIRNIVMDKWARLPPAVSGVPTLSWLLSTALVGSLLALALAILLTMEEVASAPGQEPASSPVPTSIGIFVLFPLYRSTDLAELWGTVKSCQITQMVEIRYVSQEQDDINCSSMPAGLGGKGKIDRKFEGNFERKWFRMKSAWEEAPKLMSP